MGEKYFQGDAKLRAWHGKSRDTYKKKLGERYWLPHLVCGFTGENFQMLTWLGPFCQIIALYGHFAPYLFYKHNPGYTRGQIVLCSMQSTEDEV